MTDREKLIELLENLGAIVNVPIKVDEDGCGDYSVEGADYIADYLLENGVIVPPCQEGDTIYKIAKFCEANTGLKEFYRPTKEFNEDCPYFESASWYDDADECKAIEDYLERQYCTLNLKIFCDKCKERLAIQKDKFTLSKAHQVYNAPMFNENIELRDTYFRIQEEAEKVLENLKNTK